MSRWFRVYDDAINDPKVLKLPEAMRWHWIAMLCVASKYEGELPALADMALLLRLTPQKAAAILATLANAGLLDKTETGFRPHNWDGRQYKSDVSNERVKRFRERKRNVTSDVTVTPPESEQITETDQNRERETRARDLPSALPEDFKLSETEIEAARNVGMTDADIDAELKIFIARKRSDGKKSADWSAEWLIWCARWKSLGPPRPGPVAAIDRASLDWDKQLGRFKKGLPWTTQHWGPEPGQLGCWAPAELLTKHGFEIPTAH